MTFATFQTGDETCDLCHHKCQRTYPMTHYDKTAKHFRPVRACVTCLGPSEQHAYIDTRIAQMIRFPKGRAVELPDE